MLPRSLACENSTLTLGAVAIKVVVPPFAVKAPACEKLPEADKVKFWPMVEVSSTKPNPTPLDKITSLAPLLLKLMAPLNRLLVCVNVIGFAPAVKLDVPPITKPPVCEIAPPALTVKLFPNSVAANIKPKVLVILTSLMPVLSKVTSPVNAFACVKVIGKLPVIKLAVPGTVAGADCVIAPPAVIERLPPEVKVTPGIMIGALS